MNNNGKYDDIINMPRHISKKHPQMSLEMRAAQFAPFAALTGYDEQIEETSRITCHKKELNEELKEILNEKLRIIQEKINTRPEIKITYFVQDLKKNGGKYVTETGRVKKIDKNKQLIILEDKTEIRIEDVVEFGPFAQSNGKIGKTCKLGKNMIK